VETGAEAAALRADAGVGDVGRASPLCSSFTGLVASEAPLTSDADRVRWRLVTGTLLFFFFFGRLFLSLSFSFAPPFTETIDASAAALRALLVGETDVPRSASLPLVLSSSSVPASSERARFRDACAGGMRCAVELEATAFPFPFFVRDEDMQAKIKTLVVMKGLRRCRSNRGGYSREMRL
jgi:hypothetical protein